MKEERRGVVLLRALWYNTQRSMCKGAFYDESI